VPFSYTGIGSTGDFLSFFDNRFLLSVVEEVRPLRRLHVQSLLEFQRHRESSWAAGSPAEQDSSGEENI